MKFFLRLRPFQKAQFNAGFSRGLASSADSVTNFDALERKKFVPSIESFAELKQKIYGSDKSIEKMVVRTQQLNSEKDVTMVMNRNQSTSYHCSLHLNSHLHERSAFAFIRDINDRDELIEDSKALVYGMNTPLTKKCHVQFVEIANLEHVELVNEIIWRSMTFFLSAIVKLGFRNPPEILERKAVVEDGYFYVDVGNMPGPELSPEELYRLNLFIKRDMIACNAFFQQLVIPDNIAEEYGIPTGSQICRVDNFVDLVDGPLLCRTSAFDKFIIPKSIYLGDNKMRFFGIGLPKYQPIRSLTWDIVRTNAIRRITERQD